MRKWRGLVAGLIVLTFAVWAVWYVRRNQPAFAALKELEPRFLLPLLALAVGVIFCNGLYVQIMLLVFGIRLPLREWLSLSVATSLLNFVTPLRGGAGMRAVYLKTRYNLSLVDFMSTLSAMYLMYAAAHGGLALCGIALLWHSPERPPLPVGAFFAVVTVVAVVLMLTPIRVPWADRVGFRQLARVLHGWARIRGRPGLFARLTVLTLAYVLLSLIQYKLAFAGIQRPLDWGPAMLYAGGQGLALLITITPGALGIAEWTAVYLGTVLSCTPAEVLMAQLLMRTTLISVLLLAAPFVARLLTTAAQPTSATNPRDDV